MEVSRYEAPQSEEETSWDKFRSSLAGLVKKRFFWPVLLAAVVVCALVLSLILIPSRPSTDEEQVLEDPGVSESVVPETSITQVPRIDSDGDGFFDDQEIKGWKTKDGRIYQTDPFSADSDGDGLSDMEEAGPLITEAGSSGLTYQGMSNPLKADSDDDGLDDKSEIKGWLDTDGKKYVTNPLNPDTDGDGLLDGLEAGIVIQEGNYDILSDPTRVDSDNDGLSDAEELNQDTDPFSKDSDGDGLGDGEEVLTIGTDPGMSDTDGDGITDALELQKMKLRELDPLHPNVQMTVLEWATDFAIGVVMGDLNQRDSLAWLVGTLTVSGFIMALRVGGGYVRAIAAVRDLVAAVIEEDMVGAGYAGVEIFIPAKEMKNIKRKITKFIKRNETLQFETSNWISRVPLLSEENKQELRKLIWSDEWSGLEDKGLTNEEIDQLAKNRNQLKFLNKTLDDDVIMGNPVKPFRSHNAAEMFVENEFKLQGSPVETQLVIATDSCTAGSNPLVRRHDLHVDLGSDKVMAVEIKVGQALLTDAVKMQLQSDLCLRDQGEISVIRWIFVPSALSGQVGMTSELKNYLEENGVEIYFRGIR